MSPTPGPGWSGNLSASLHLFGVSVRRLFRSRQTMVSLILLGFAVLAVIAWTLRRERSPAEFIEQVFLTIYVPVLLPVFCLCYGTAGIAAEREERTLVYLLVTPLPRPCVFAAKSAASAVLGLGWTLGSLLLLCQLAGKSGIEARHLVWPVVVWSTLAYVALFLLFSVVFRRATIVAFAYALFLETLIGNMPGIAKRLAISFYTRCMVWDVSSVWEIKLTGPNDPAIFLPIPGPTAQVVLCALSGGLFLAALLVFTFREYAS